jgi:hypothetical protein
MFLIYYRFSSVNQSFQREYSDFLKVINRVRINGAHFKLPHLAWLWLMQILITEVCVAFAAFCAVKSLV